MTRWEFLKAIPAALAGWFVGRTASRKRRPLQIRATDNGHVIAWHISAQYDVEGHLSHTYRVTVHPHATVDDLAAAVRGEVPLPENRPVDGNDARFQRAIARDDLYFEEGLI